MGSTKIKLASATTNMATRIPIRYRTFAPLTIAPKIPVAEIPWAVPPGFNHQHDGCQAQGKGVAGNMRLIAELTATDARTGATRVCHEVLPGVGLMAVSECSLQRRRLKESCSVSRLDCDLAGLVIP